MRLVAADPVAAYLESETAIPMARVRMTSSEAALTVTSLARILDPPVPSIWAVVVLEILLTERLAPPLAWPEILTWPASASISALSVAATLSVAVGKKPLKTPGTVREGAVPSGQMLSVVQVYADRPAES